MLQDRIMVLVSHRFGVPVEDMRSKSRKQEFVFARQVAMSLMRERTSLTLRQIGAMFEDRDYSTVCSAIKSAENMRDTNADFRKKYNQVDDLLTGIGSLKKAYLSGPMTGLPDLNKAEFMKAEAILNCAWYDVVNPHTLPAPAHDKWEEYMKNDLKYMLDCDVVAVLHGWENSRGARLEVQIAHTLGIEIVWAYNLKPLSESDITIGLQPIK